MRLFTPSIKQLAAILCWILLAYSAQSEERISDTHINELSKIKTLFPDADLVPCNFVRDISPVECSKASIYTGYLTWKVFYFIKFKDLDFEISSGQARWTAFLPFAEGVNTDRSPTIKEISYRRDKFFASNSLSSCLKASCGRVLKFKSGTTVSAASFWEKSFKFILCMEHRNRTKDPRIFDAGPAYFYHLASLGKIKDCGLDKYPSGLAEIIQVINPERSF